MHEPVQSRPAQRHHPVAVLQSLLHLVCGPRGLRHLEMPVVAEELFQHAAQIGLGHGVPAQSVGCLLHAPGDAAQHLRGIVRCEVAQG